MYAKEMNKPIFKQYNTPEERAEAFRRMIHLREEWEEHIRQIKAAKQMAWYNCLLKISTALLHIK